MGSTKSPRGSQIERYIRPESIRASLEKIIPNAHISEGRFEGITPGTLQDLEWNHMDQTHRIYLHNAFHDAIRVATGEDFAISTTRWKNLPIFIQVSDLRIRPGFHYQIFSVFGLIYCHQVSRLVETEYGTTLSINWYTASSRWLRPLHWPFNRMLVNLQKKQFGEDACVREQRCQLKAKGFAFTTADPTFINSNTMDNHVILPPFQSAKADLNSVRERQSVQVGPLSFIVEQAADGFRLWPGICPHEGAPLKQQHICNETAQAKCPWHGLKFKPWRFASTETGSFVFLNHTISFEKGWITLHGLAEEKEPVPMKPLKPLAVQPTIGTLNSSS